LRENQRRKNSNTKALADRNIVSLSWGLDHALGRMKQKSIKTAVMKYDEPFLFNRV
jgi:hypothetical protein